MPESVPLEYLGRKMTRRVAKNSLKSMRPSSDIGIPTLDENCTSSKMVSMVWTFNLWLAKSPNFASLYPL